MGYSKIAFIREQPLLSSLYENLCKKDRLSHAYLLYGEKYAPLLESATYIAKSIECSKEVFACNKCDACLRFDEGTHPDFVLIDGTKNLIKKGDIDDLSRFFSLSTLEKGHKGVYILSGIENITQEASNALLKFLEEPKGDVVALLTTSNIQKVLDTIKSRCEIVHVKSPNLQKVVEDYSGKVSIEEYYIVSNLVYSENEKEEILDSKEFHDAYHLAHDYVLELYENASGAGYLLISGSEKIKGNKCYNYFYTILSIFFTEAIMGEENSPLYELTNGLVNKKVQVSKSLVVLGEAIAKSQANMNFTFTLARLIKILEEK